MSIFGKSASTPATRGAFAPKSQQTSDPSGGAASPASRPTPADALTQPVDESPTTTLAPVVEPVKARTAFGGATAATAATAATETPASQAPAPATPENTAGLTVLEILQGKRVAERPLGVSSQEDRASKHTDNPMIAFGAQAAFDSEQAKESFDLGFWTPQIKTWHEQWANATVDQRAEILTGQLDGLSHLAMQHLDELTDPSANLPALPTMAMLLRLTYARLKEHPDAANLLSDGSARAAALVARRMASTKAGAAARKKTERELSRSSTSTETNKAAFGGFSL